MTSWLLFMKIRVLTVVDTFSRFSPAIDPRFSYRAEDVVTALEGACELYLPAVQQLGADQINPGLSLWLDEKTGSGHRLSGPGPTNRLSSAIDDVDQIETVCRELPAGVDRLNVERELEEIVAALHRALLCKRIPRT